MPQVACIFVSSWLLPCLTLNQDSKWRCTGCWLRTSRYDWRPRPMPCHHWRGRKSLHLVSRRRPDWEQPVRESTVDRRNPLDESLDEVVVRRMSMKSTSAETTWIWMKADWLDGSPASTLVCKADVESVPKRNTDPQGFVAESSPHLGNWIDSNPIACVTLGGGHVAG